MTYNLLDEMAKAIAKSRDHIYKAFPTEESFKSWIENPKTCPFCGSETKTYQCSEDVEGTDLMVTCHLVVCTSCDEKVCSHTIVEKERGQKIDWSDVKGEPTNG